MKTHGCSVDRAKRLVVCYIPLLGILFTPNPGWSQTPGLQGQVARVEAHFTTTSDELSIRSVSTYDTLGRPVSFLAANKYIYDEDTMHEEYAYEYNHSGNTDIVIKKDLISGDRTEICDIEFNDNERLHFEMNYRKDKSTPDEILFNRTIDNESVRHTEKYVDGHLRSIEHIDKLQQEGYFTLFFIDEDTLTDYRYYDDRLRLVLSKSSRRTGLYSQYEYFPGDSVAESLYSDSILSFQTITKGSEIVFERFYEDYQGAMILSGETVKKILEKDAYGNWTLMETYYNGEVYNRTERTITYYKPCHERKFLVLSIRLNNKALEEKPTFKKREIQEGISLSISFDTITGCQRNVYWYAFSIDLDSLRPENKTNPTDYSILRFSITYAKEGDLLTRSCDGYSISPDALECIHQAVKKGTRRFYVEDIILTNTTNGKEKRYRAPMFYFYAE